MRYWCSEGCGFVEPNHRCEQWSRLTHISTEAEAAIRAEVVLAAGRLNEENQRLQGEQHKEYQDPNHTDAEIMEGKLRRALQMRSSSQDRLRAINQRLQARITELEASVIRACKERDGYVETAKAQSRHIVELEASQQWVPVSERLPEGQCLVHLDKPMFGRKVHSAVYEGRYAEIGGVFSFDTPGITTHWMPLPPPPKEPTE